METPKEGKAIFALAKAIAMTGDGKVDDQEKELFQRFLAAANLSASDVGLRL